MTSNLEYQNGVQSVALDPIQKFVSGSISPLAMTPKPPNMIKSASTMRKSLLVETSEQGFANLLATTAHSLQVLTGHNMMHGDRANVDKLMKMRTELMGLVQNIPDFLKDKYRLQVKKNIKKFNELFTWLVWNTGMAGGGDVGFKPEHIHSEDMLAGFQDTINTNDKKPFMMEFLTIAREVAIIYGDSGQVEDLEDLALIKVVHAVEEGQKIHTQMVRWLSQLDLYKDMQETKELLKTKIGSPSDEFNAALVGMAQELCYPTTCLKAKAFMEKR
jgi:hypothetical protein